MIWWLLPSPPSIPTGPLGSLGTLWTDGNVTPWEEESLLSLRQMEEAVLSSELSQYPLCHQVMRKLRIILISVSCSSGEAWRREEEPDYSTMPFLFFLSLAQDMLRVEIHITCTQAGNNNFCSHDSTVSVLFIFSPFICAVFVPCCLAV